MDKNKKTASRQLKYRSPEILSLEADQHPLKSGQFSFQYPKYGTINCYYKIFLAKHELNNYGDTKEAGLLICAGPISILDCTLFNRGGKIANRFFGEAILEGPLRKISKEQRILNERRVGGLLPDTPLYENLERNLGPILEKLIEKERKRLAKSYRNVQEGVLEKKDKLLKALNKIAKNIEKDETEIIGDEKFDPGEGGIRFCLPEDSYLKIIENQDKNLYLVVDKSKIPLNSEIIIKSDLKGIEISPNRFLVKEMEITDNEISLKKKINFRPLNTKEYKITAHVSGMLFQTDLYVDVIEDKRLQIKNAIDFIPSEQDIVSKKYKKFSLIINFSKVDKNKDICFVADDIFELNNKIKLKKARKIKDNIYELDVKVFCKGKPKEKGNIKAILREYESELSLNVISSRDKHLKGPFENIKDDTEIDPQEIGAYLEDEKTIAIFVNHPLLKHYKPETSPYYRTLYADIIVKEAFRELTRKHLKPFTNDSAEGYRTKFDKKFNKYYKKHGVPLHKFCIDPSNLELLKS